MIIMKTHIQIVAILHIAMGILSLVGAIVVFAIFGLLGGFIMSQGEHGIGGMLGVAAIVFGGFLAVLALPSIIGGWGLYTERPWARPLVLVLGAIQLFHVPIGTALGAYTFWALLFDPAMLTAGSQIPPMSPTPVTPTSSPIIPPPGDQAP